MAVLPKTGVFCLEGAWERRLDNRTSVLPTLEALERLRLATYIHRDVATPEELDFYIRKWSQKGYSDYRVLFLAFHGDNGAIYLGRKPIDLQTLAECIDGRATGRVIYFGSCSVLGDKNAVAAFQKTTRAKLVCGYTKAVDWVEAAAFDLLLLDSLVSNVRIDARVNRLRRRYPDLTAVLGFASHPTFPRSTD